MCYNSFNICVNTANMPLTQNASLCEISKQIVMLDDWRCEDDWLVIVALAG
jgi:hypothetical protein